MAGIATESSVGGASNGQRCEYGEALVEWRSSEQVENGTPSTSPPYWDTDDDDDCGRVSISFDLSVSVFTVTQSVVTFEYIILGLYGYFIIPYFT